MGGQLVLRGTHGPRTSCPGGQLVLGSRVWGDNLRRGTSHPMRMDTVNMENERGRPGNDS